MRQDIRDAFEAAINTDTGSMYQGKIKSDTQVRREAMLFTKQVELLIENLPDQDLPLQELYSEIAGQAWHGA